MPYCAKCGHSNPDEAKFCTGCGAGLNSHPSSPAVTDSAPAASAAVVGAPAPDAPPEPTRRRVMWIPLAAAAVLLLAGAAYGVWYYNENIKPMDVDEYEETVSALATSTSAGFEDLGGSIIQAYDSESADSTVDSDDLAQYTDDLDAIASELIELRDLRPPNEYEEEHDTIVRGADVLLAYVEQIETTLDAADGSSWEDLMSQLSGGGADATAGDEKDLEEFRDTISDISGSDELYMW